MKSFYITILILLTINCIAQVGINTTSPNAQLEIKSSNQVTPANNDGIIIPKIDAFPVTNPTASQQSMMVYLTTTVSGKLPGFYYWDNATTTWISLSGAKGWDLNGNTGTTEGTNFIGTTDNHDMVFKTNNIENLRISYANGNVGIGTASPLAKFQVALSSGNFYVPNWGVGGGNTILGVLASNTTAGGQLRFTDSSIDFYDIGRNSTGGFVVERNDNTQLLLNSLGNFGIGTSSPTEKLDVAGNLKVSGAIMPNNLAGTTGQVLTSAGAGVAPTWVNAPTVANEWHTTGNSGTTASNFIGTTDAQNLDFRTNNAIKMRLTQKGQLEFLNTGNSVFIGEQAGLNDDLTANNNVFVGYQSGKSTTTGEGNSALGFQSLYLNTTGIENIANGYRSLYSNITGSRNIANGSEALYSNSTGSSNIAIGAFSLRSNTGGVSNVAIGDNSLQANNTGQSNIAIGKQAMYFNTGGYDNIANGDRALYRNVNGNNNIANGNSALFNNLGSNNIANGYWALNNNTLGYQNIANGYEALVTNTTGNDNIANGYRSLRTNTSGSNNIANGNFALFTNDTGNNNIANGFFSLRYNITGSNNIANGYQALYNTTGSNNIGIGLSTGSTITSGSNNIAIGNNAQIQTITANDQLSIGNVIYGSTMSTTALGKIGIGEPNPTEKLDVAGNLKVSGAIMPNNLAGTTGQVLTSAGTGAAPTWINAPTIANEWHTTGNSGTVAGTNFIGTTDNVNLIFKRNNIKAGTIGVDNTALGVNSFFSNTTGGSNVAIGNRALYTPTDSYYNVAIGDYSLTSTTTGRYNSALGVNSLYSNTSGYGNVATGYNSLLSNSIGIGNTAQGIYSLKTNTSGNYNTAMGQQSMENFVSGNYNTAIGLQSMALSTGGDYNTALGSETLRKNTSGIGNVAIGRLTLSENTTGNFNVGIGFQNLISLTSGYQNTAVGQASGGAINTGIQNTTIGYGAGNSITSGSNNIAIGGLSNVPNPVADNQLSIANVVYGTNLTSTSSGKIGIGEPNPTEKLEVAGNLKVSGAIMPNNLPGTTGQVLSSAGAGIAPTWKSSSVQKFSTTGTLGGIYNVALTEYTIRVFNVVSEIRLPNAVGNQGKIFVIIGSNGIGAKLFSSAGGIIYDDVTNTAPTYINPNERYTVQSDGNDWIVIGR